MAIIKPKNLSFLNKNISNLSTKKYKNIFGITLIEVLVALSIISISLISAWRALNLSINNYASLQDSILTSIIAKNILVEISLKQLALPNKFICVKDLTFICEIKTQKTPNKYLYLVDISVYKNISSTQQLQHLVTLLPYKNS